MSKYFSVTSVQNGRARDLPARSLSHPITCQGPSILSTCPPIQKVGALQFLRAPAGDGIQEPTGISSRGEPSVKTTSTCRLRGQYKTKDYVQFTLIYMHTVYPRRPEYLGVMAKNKRKYPQTIKCHTPLLPPRRLNSVAPAREFSSSRPFVECTCPLESYTGAKV